MNHIFSPWRMNYIESDKKLDGCVFCKAIAEKDGPENLIVSRGKLSFVILNRYPYTSGHVMVLPYKHVPTLTALDKATRIEMMEFVSQSTEILQNIYKPQGYNIGANIGEAAGAGIEEHIHLHVVPRWTGDTNFMSSLGETRVLPETMEESFKRIITAWQAHTNN
ncbi:MAG: HIT domain-containing protein [Chloroflexota bacterium]